MEQKRYSGSAAAAARRRRRPASRPRTPAPYASRSSGAVRRSTATAYPPGSSAATRAVRRSRRRRRRWRRIRQNVILSAVLIVVMCVSGLAIFRPALEKQAEEEAVPAMQETEPEISQPVEPEPVQEPEEKVLNYPTGEPGPEEKVVYLTIDDGPSKNTGKLLDILDEYDAQATWFVTAQYLSDEKLMEALKEIHDRGHAIGVHSYSHEYRAIYESVDSFMADYDRMNSMIVAAIGESSGLLRFPGGSNTGYNSEIRSELLAKVKEKGLIYYDWNAFIGDTENLSTLEMIAKAVKESSYNNKTILLMHDAPDKEDDLDALSQILSALQEKGYQFRKLDPGVLPIQFES